MCRWELQKRQSALKKKEKGNMMFVLHQQTPPILGGLIIQRHVGGALFRSTVTCKDLTKPSEVEESTLRHGEQLTQEHQEGDRGEDHRENHQDLHCLKPLWERKTFPHLKTSLSSQILPREENCSCKAPFFLEVYKMKLLLTSFFGGCTQPGSCEVVKPAVVP